MNCRERKAFLSLQEEKDRNEAILRRRIAKERADRKAKQIDTLFTGFAIMMCGIGAAAFIYALMSFAHWAEFGF